MRFSFALALAVAATLALLDEAGTFNYRVAGHLGLTDAVTAMADRLAIVSAERGDGIAILLGGVPGVPAARVVIIGGGGAGAGRAGPARSARRR